MITNQNSQQLGSENSIRELQQNNFSQEGNSQTKVVGAKSSDQKLFVIHNGIETKMTVEEIFDSKFTDLKVVSYNVVPDFVTKISKNKNVTIIFNYGCLKYFIEDCEEKFYTLDDFKNIDLRIGKNEMTIHDKIFLLSDAEKNLYRVVTGSANFTNAAFESNFETVRVDDSKEIYDLYLQRFNYLLPQTQTKDSVPELKNLNKNLKGKLSNYVSSGQFYKDLKEKNKFTKRKSNFKNLDEQQQAIYPGLYILGGAPAVGKTTFVWQLLNQLAENGERCIFCSYQSSSFDLSLKSMAQENFFHYRSKKRYGYLTAEYIKKNPDDENVKKLISEFNCNLQVIELKNET